VTLSAADEDGGSGVASTSYQVNGGDWAVYEGAIALTEGVNTVAFKSVDNAGNEEDATTITVKIDETAPTLAWDAAPAADGANGWYVNPVTLTYTTDDNLSGVATEGNEVEISTQGLNQTTTVTVTDNAGNSATFTSEQSFNIDYTAPTTKVNVIGSKNPLGKYTGNVVVSLSATDNLNGSGVASTWYSIDGKEPRLYGASFVVAGVGTHTVEVSSVDVAGNIEVIHSTSITIDKPGSKR
jgi:hypothetical protein